MNDRVNEMTARRQVLAAQIARQRVELAQAYLQIERPIHYAEYGLRCFGFFRKNPWVFAAVPAAFSILSSLIGSRRRKAANPEHELRQSQAKARRGVSGAVQTVARHGWNLFQFYRQVRPYFP